MRLHRTKQSSLQGFIGLKIIIVVVGQHMDKRSRGEAQQALVDAVDIDGTGRCALRTLRHIATHRVALSFGHEFRKIPIQTSRIHQALQFEDVLKLNPCRLISHLDLLAHAAIRQTNKCWL